MLRFSVAKFLPPGTTSANGTVIGEDHRQEILSLLSTRERSAPTIFLLDYADVEHATSSYVKRTALWLFRCGGAFCGSSEGMGADELLGDLGGIVPIPTNVFPVAANLSADIRDEINEVFARRALPFLEALKFGHKEILSAGVLGQPEPSVQDTLVSIAGLNTHEITAKTLFGAMSKAGIGLTAWGNRLSDLHRLRLLDRRKQGKEWVYRPVASTFEYGRKNHI